VQAALLNSTFIQGFELDDWHSRAPIHLNAIVIPSLFAAIEHILSKESNAHFSGKDFLVSALAGFETGPRVGNGLYGGHVLTMGWHSGAIFGPSAAAAAVVKLLKLPSESVEDALGIACTQACGLMSAQYESEVKRMQHGFAARNGLFAALLARKGYIGIKKVYERPYGGFLATFNRGSGKEPPYLENEISANLGTEWMVLEDRVKAYAAMAGTHATVDCIKGLQEEYPEKMADLTKVASIRIEMAEVAYHHGGWEAARPIRPTGAQMSAAYVGATQMVDKQVLAYQFRPDQIDRDEVWDLVSKSVCVHNTDFDKFRQRVTVTFDDGASIQHQVEFPRGVKPFLSNEEVVEKWRGLVKGLIDEERRDKIEKLVLES
jgi:aconitate decarboxylase